MSTYYSPLQSGPDPIRDVLKALCRATPPRFVKGYTLSGLTDAEHHALTEWALANDPVGWLTGYSMLEAAVTLVAEAVSNGNIVEAEYWTREKMAELMAKRTPQARQRLLKKLQDTKEAIG